MAFIHGRSAAIFWAQYDLSAYLNQAETEASVDVPETTTFGATAVRRQVVGLKEGSATLSGFHDTTAGATHPVLTAAIAAASASAVTICPEGSTIALPAKLLSVRVATYTTGEEVDGVVPAAVNLATDGGGVDHGVSLRTLASAGSSGNGTGVDGVAATTNGGVGHIHATAVSGTSPTADVVIADSADNAAFATILTFSQITAATSQRVEITGTVRRYLRETRTIGGTATPTVTYTVAFARR